MKTINLAKVLFITAFGISCVGSTAHAGATNVNKGQYCTTKEWAAGLKMLKDAQSLANAKNDASCGSILSDAVVKYKKDVMPTLSQGGRTLVMPD